MIIGNIKKQPTGYNAFIPNRFPPKEGLSLSASTLRKSEEAMRLIGKLDGITRLLPDLDFFLFMYIRKDAAASSQIEGTNASLEDAIEAEAKTDAGVPDDVDDILHYIKALNYGIKRMKNFPLSLRLIRELHKELMDGARTTHHPYPGEFRRSQNWIGGTSPKNARFVPPPPEEMNQALNDLEEYLHRDDASVSLLVKAAMAHAQFEVIHPFTDGNGRTGRMLTTISLLKDGLLEQPVLFLSSFFRKNQQEYYDRLSGYSNDEVEEWVSFFLDGVVEISEEAIDTASKVTKIRDRDILKIQTLSKRSSESAVKVLPRLFALPIVTTRNIREWTGFSRAGAQNLVDRFVELKILYPRKTDALLQSYIYKDYVNIFTR